MVVVLVWLGLICCSAANGIIWYFDEIPDAYMLLVLLLCAVLIVVHRHCTRKWCKARAKENGRTEGVYGDYDEDHPSIFLISGAISSGLMLVCGVLLLISIFFGSAIASYSSIISSCFVGLLTASIFFAGAFLREAMYT